MDSDKEEAFVQFDEDGDKVLNPGELTELEKQYKQKAVSQHRKNMIKQQKNFKGRAFIGKPDKIEFKDFTVGKTHQLVLTLTNVSNAFNSFNVLPLPAKIRNYFEVEYTPKGKISPGISTDIRFKFFPQLNEDIFSEFTIQSETGPISYDIVCLSKKTIVKTKNPVVDFGKIIYGEIGNASLTLFNEGTLDSDLKIQCLQIFDKSSEEMGQALKQIKFEPNSHINGHSEKLLNFEFVPSQIGHFEAEFEVYIKNFIHSPPIKLRMQGVCTEVPVRIEKQSYEFEICLLNHIYREKLVFYNKGEIPMSFKVTQPNQTKKYFEFNPIIGYIQKESKIDIWVKFTAEKDLGIYLNKYLVDSNVYEIPFQMSVKEQVLPVTFNVRFKMTSEKINIRPMELNFGTIFEGLSSKIEVTFENQSDLPQEVLLHPLKKNISIENDQPLFKILPKEVVRTFITYRTKKLQDSGKTQKDQGSIPCKVITGDISTNQIKIEYAAETMRPDLFIENNKIDLAALQVNERCQVSTVFKNNSNKQIIYELFSPYFEVSGLKVTPVVKVLSPKQEIEVIIEYHSADRALTAKMMNELKKKYEKKQLEVEEPVQPKQQPEPKKEAKKDAKKEGKLTKQQQEALEQEQKRLEEEERLRKQREEEELLEMERNFNADLELEVMGGQVFDFGTTQHYKWLMPIYFKQKEYPDASAEINFIEITTTSVKKTLLIDQEVIDFGEIAVGSRAIRELVIVNEGESADLKKKHLPIFCCFSVINSLKTVEQGGSFKAVVQFQPIQEQKFEQRLVFHTDKYTVSCLLKGKGVRPEVQIEPENGLLSMGGVMVGESIEKVFKVKNICNFPIQFLIKRIGEGVLNSTSTRAISYVPMTGTIIPDESTEIKVAFKPDRVGENFFEKICVFVEEQKEEKSLYITGLAYPRQAYVRDYIEHKMPADAEVKRKVESTFDWMRIRDEDKIYGPNKKNIMLQFDKLEEGVDNEKSLKRRITIGSCKLLDPKNEKPTNFQIVMPKDDKFFECDNLKGTVGAGTETHLTFTFKPQQTDPFISKIPVLVGIGQWKQSKAELKLSGGFVKPGTTDALSLEIILKAYINQL